MPDVYEQIQYELWAERMGREHLKPLTAHQVYQSFPEECVTYVPGRLKDLKKVLKPHFANIKRIRLCHYDLWIEQFLLMVVESYSPKADLAELARLESISSLLNGPAGNDRLTPEMVARAKEVSIESLYTFEKPIRSAGRLKVICPFHGEKTPSFVIYTKSSGSSSENTFHCFGCGVGRDAIDFYMLIHDVSFPQAVKNLVR